MKGEASKPIRVLITEDSPLVAIMMRELLNQDSQIEVVGWAKNGQEAIDLSDSLVPDVITMDLNMPVMSGLKAIEAIASNRPVPILAVSQMIESRDSDIAFEALCSGAADIMSKPSGYGQRGFLKVKEELISRIKSVAKIQPRRFRMKQQPNAAALKLATERKPRGGLVAIGASTGGPAALTILLKGFPPDFPIPIAVVQHIAPGFLVGLSQWLKRISPLPVKVGEDQEPLKAGTVYLAPDNYHLEINIDKKLVLNDDPPVRNHRPSVDYLMKSTAASYGRRSIGVLLTGMGNDGAEGLKQIRDAGGKTIAQNEATSLVFGMPKEAISRGAAQLVSPLEEIASEIVRAAIGEERKADRKNGG
jgi:two-component system chemotaxis response regulator CheB